MAISIRQLRAKLCRELAQAEHDAVIHCSREAGRYGARPPGQILRVIADHAAELRPQLRALFAGNQSLGIRAGRFVGEVFSAVRHFALDRMIDAERSYRATLLGLRHGLDVARLLRAVLVQQQDHRALHVCDVLIEGRSRLLARAEDRLSWFAENPDIALHSSCALVGHPRAAQLAAKPPAALTASRRRGLDRAQAEPAAAAPGALDAKAP